MKTPHSLNSLADLIGLRRDSQAIDQIWKRDDLTLDVEEDLEEGVPQRSFLESHENGYVISFSGDVAQCVFIYMTSADEFDSFAGALPFDLSSQSTRQTVMNAMGTPDRSGEARNDSVIGDTGAWDRYQYRNVIAHFQFRLDNQGIALITLMDRECAP